MVTGEEEGEKDDSHGAGKDVQGRVVVVMLMVRIGKVRRVVL